MIQYDLSQPLVVSFKSNYDAGSTQELNTSLRNFMESELRSKTKEYYCLSGSQEKQVPLPLTHHLAVSEPIKRSISSAGMLCHGLSARSWDRRIDYSSADFWDISQLC